MRKFLLMIGVLCSLFSFGQNAIVGSGFTNGWNAGCGSNTGDFEYFSTSAGNSYISTQTANGTGNQYWRFGIDWGGTIAQRTITVGVDTEVNSNTAYTLNGTCTTTGAMYTNVSSTSHNYIFKTSEAGSNPAGNFIFFKVEGTVRSVSSVSTPAIVLPNKNIIIEATLDGAFSTGQSVYLRYTDDNFSTSTVVEMTGSGTSYLATIPSSINTASTSINYYVFTSGNGLTISAANADFYTINLNNNSASNYSYTVASSVEPGSGNMITFDGTDDYVDVADEPALDLTSNWTLEAWVKLDAIGSQYGIIEKYDNAASTGGYILRITSGNKVYVSTVNGTTGSFVASTTSLEANKWYHIAGTYDEASTTIKVYINGVLEGTNSSVTFTSLAGTYPLRIGARGNDLLEKLDGQLDEVRIWNKTLSDLELRDYMCQKITSSHSNFANLVAYFDFDEGSGDYVGSLGSGGGGKLNNSPTWATSAAPIGDESTYDYGNGNSTTITETHTDGSNFKIDGFTGTPDGAHVYLVNETPNSTTRSGFSGSLDETRYYGAFVVGGTSPSYNITYNYTGNTNITGGAEEEARLGARDDNSGTTWSILTNNADVNTEGNTITKGCYSATQKEFVAGFDNTANLAVEQSSGYALGFDGTDDYVTTGVEITPLSGTFEAWISRDDWSTYNHEYIFGNGIAVAQNDAFYATFHPSVGVHFRYGGTGQDMNGYVATNSSTSFTANSWHHIAFTWNDVAGTKTLSVFIDGVLQGTTTTSSTVTYGTNTYFGGLPAALVDLDYFGIGKMDEVRIWTKVLSQSVIQDWMCKKVASSHPDYCDLASYYRFDENTGTSLKDYAGSANGTINGAAYQTSSAPTGAAASVNATTVTSSTTANLAASAGDDITVNVTSGTADLLQVFRIDGESNSKTSPGGIDNMSRYNYFGVKAFGASSLVYEVVYNYDGHAGITDETELYLCSRADNSSSWTLTAATRDTDANTLTLGGQTGTEFILGSGIPGNALPVDLIDFKIENQNGKANLIWSTASEINSQSFEILRSTDAKNWEKVGEVLGKGNSNLMQQYEFTDNKSLTSNFSYYKLKQIDLNGEFVYSNVLLFEIENNQQTKIYPNPTTDVLNFQFGNNVERNITLSNIMGEQVMSLPTISNRVFRVNIAELPKGFYFIEIESGGQKEVQKVLKQ